MFGIAVSCLRRSMLALGIGFSYLWLVWLNKPVDENCPVDKNYSREKEQRLQQNPAA